MTYFKVFFISLLLLVSFSGIGICAQQTVRLPINLDYPLLETLVAAKGFPERGNSVTLVDEWGGCIQLKLANPRIHEARQTICLEVNVFAYLSTPLGERCLSPVDWHGKLILYQKPYFKGQNWKLHFKTQSMELEGLDWVPEKIRTILWDFIEPRAISYIDEHVVIDLMPPVESIKSVLLPMFPANIQNRSQRMLDSLRPGEVNIGKNQVQVNVLADVKEIYEPVKDPEKIQLTEEQIDQVVTLWEDWDSMLTFLVTTLAREVLSDEERSTLMNLLLDTRHRFVEGLSRSEINNDFVRKQFIDSWQTLSPIFHNHLYKKEQSDASMLLGYLAFVSSADALMILDHLGPSFGIEISRNGLIRMIHILGGDPSLLNYGGGTNPQLQKLFEMNLNNRAEEEKENDELPLINSILNLLSPPQAFATQLPTFAEIRKWQVPSRNKEDYIERVETLLETSILKAEHNELYPLKWQENFRDMILAIAWQESCLRQFVVRKKKLTYLLSYNKSSVGLMQVNERIWRGIYRRDRLRWDIRYNSYAGCEIAARYFRKYALKDPQVVANLSPKYMAGLVYAMYNGGPSQYKKYLQRKAKNSFYQSDKLFLEKYGSLLENDTKNLRKCLMGG